jgi:hypothetical protein
MDTVYVGSGDGMDLCTEVKGKRKLEVGNLNDQTPTEEASHTSEEKVSLCLRNLTYKSA